MRATMSLALPAANGTIAVMVLLGQACAEAWLTPGTDSKAINTAPNATAKRRGLPHIVMDHSLAVTSNLRVYAPFLLVAGTLAGDVATACRRARACAPASPTSRSPMRVNFASRRSTAD